MARPLVRRGLKLVASIVAACAAALWLAFFVEHLTEWFTGPQAPPLFVWAAQLAHLGILVGLIASLRWRLAGSIGAVLSVLVFFALTVWPPVPLLFIPTIAPALLFLAAWLMRGDANAQRLRA
jgi:hypothetical protein